MLTCPPGHRAPRSLPRWNRLWRGQTARSVIDRLAAINFLPVRTLMEQVTTQPVAVSSLTQEIALTPPALERLAALAHTTPEHLATMLDPDTVAPRNTPEGHVVALTRPWQQGLTECARCIHDHDHARRGASTWAATLCCLRHRRWCLDSQAELAGVHAALWPAFATAQRQLTTYRHTQLKEGVSDQLLAGIYSHAADTITTWLTTHCPYGMRRDFDELYQNHRTLVADRTHLLFSFTVTLTQLITPFVLNPRAELLKQPAAATFAQLAEAAHTLPGHPNLAPAHWHHLYRQLRNNAALLTGARPL
ncbi:hypothetical protein AB0L88_06090 [Saccharopolyspora shandongensis]|uniref:hypothetical protein n=1 Tax=Saccharopolyspora shandongensis TaxID=418495 RepID=UPI0034435056